MRYEDLEIWKIANELVEDIHQLTLYDIPKFEMYENGSQIRRSMKSLKSNIVEGYRASGFIEHRVIEHRVIEQSSIE
jgi:four helix bundle protein